MAENSQGCGVPSESELVIATGTGKSDDPANLAYASLSLPIVIHVM